ncbi:MAG: hypothetical protein KBE42_11525 [Steroidobacteraceae bacterium]|nr:hypothetical protein [Steroidobacteraceae bacterium]
MTRSVSFLAATWAAFGLLLSSVPAIAADPSAEVTSDQISAARTAADHEAIAAEYDAEAAAAEKKAAAHAMMAKTYRAGGSPKGNPQAMVAHCDRLVSQYEAAAKEYRALASEHRQMAGHAGQ